LNHVVTLAFCIPGLACVAAQDNQPQLAAQLLGIAEALRAQVVTLGSASDLNEYDRLLTEARGKIDTQAYAAEISAGRTLPQPDAVAFALSSFADYN